METQKSYAEKSSIRNTFLALLAFLGFIILCIMFLRWLISVIGRGLISAGI